MASITVTMAGSPSGIAATARLIDVINIVNTGICRSKPITKIRKQMPKAPNPVCDRFPLISFVMVLFVQV